MVYDILSIKMTSQSLSNFCIELTSRMRTALLIMIVTLSVYAQNVIEHKFSWKSVL